MRTGFSCVLLAALALPSPAQVAPPNAVVAAQQLQRAELARRHGDEVRAVQLACSVLAFAPDDFAARTFLGYRMHSGRWRLPQEIAYLERASAPAQAVTPPRAAAEPEPARAAAPVAARPPAVARRGPARLSPAAFGLFALRLQNVRVLGIDKVTVGFGSGTGTLQLPRTESVSFGGTVMLPLGSGR